MDETPGSITERQNDYIAGLVEKKDLTGNTRWVPSAEQRSYLEAGDYSAMSKAQASEAIKKLLELNDKAAKPVPFDLTGANVSDGMWMGKEPTPDPHDDEDYAYSGMARADVQAEELAELEDRVSAGHYFIVDPTVKDDDEAEKFFKVDKPTDGKWAGRTFLSVRASDDFYPIRDTSHKIAIYTEILKDPVNSMNQYGMRIGACGVCGRTLTRRDSILRGIGPICASRLTATAEQIDLLERMGLRKQRDGEEDGDYDE